MTENVRSMSLEFARDPDSLVFLRLGEALRVRGELDAAASVVLAGMERYPELPEARDLYARVLLDLGHLPEARQVWEGVVRLEPRHQSAHKGLGFLFYSEGDLDSALEHLETALSIDPTDESTVQAVRLVRATAAEADVDDEVLDAAEVERPVFQGLEGQDSRLLLVDAQGLVLGGGLLGADGANVGDEIGAYLTAVSQEAARTSRLLDLGNWRWMIVEAEGGNLQITRPTAETQLLVCRDRSVPTGRLAFVAAKANAAAAAWLEDQSL